MKIRVCLLALLLVPLTASLVTYSQGQKKPRTAEDYRPRTLKELSTLVPEIIAANPDYQKSAKELAVLYHGDLLPSRIKVVFDGATRPFDDRKKGLVKQWADQYAGMPEFYTGPYEEEALFSDGAAHFWLGVRKENLPTLGHDLKSGESIELFVIKLGGVRMNQSDPELEPVILIEKFAKQ